MTLPEVKVVVSADTDKAVKGIADVSKSLAKVPAAGSGATKSARGFAGAMKRLGSASGQTRSQIQNMAFQFQDMAVQIEMGTSVSRTLSQQLPQLAGGFGVVGAAVGVLAGVGIPLLAFAFSKLGGEGDRLAKTLAGVRDVSKDISAELAMLESGAQSQEEQAVIEDIKRLEEARLVTLAKIAKLDGISSATLNRRLDGQERSIALFNLELKNMRDLRAERDATRALIDDERRALEAISTEYVDILGSEAGLGKAVAANNALYADRLRLMASEDPLSAFGGEGRFIPEPFRPLPGSGGGGGGGGGDGGALDTLIDSLKTEQELAEEFRAEGLAALQSASEAELEVLGGLNEAKLRLEQEYQDRLSSIKGLAADSQLALTLGAGGDVLAALGAFSDKALKLAKVAGAAQALVSTYQGAAEALKLPFPANIAAAAAVTAKGIGLVAAIKGVSGSGGGGGGGGAAAAAVGASAAQTPLQVSLTGINPGDMFSGSQLSGLFERLQDEAGDRGLEFV